MSQTTRERDRLATLAAARQIARDLIEQARRGNAGLVAISITTLETLLAAEIDGKNP